MQIHSIPSRNIKTKKRVGRGGKRGTYCGRGMKGQKSRSGGGKIDPLFEGGRSSLIERMKKNRGFKSPHEKKISISLASLEQVFQDGDLVSPKTLVRSFLVDKTRVKFGVKVLGTGKLTKKLIIAGNIFLSEMAREAILKVGGTIEKKKGVKEEKGE